MAYDRVLKAFTKWSELQSDGAITYSFSKGDLRQDEVARGACEGQDVVFHLAAAHRGRGYIDSHPVDA